MLYFKYTDTLESLVKDGKCLYPVRSTVNSAGYDLCLPISEPLIIPPHSSVELDFGVSVEVEEGTIDDSISVLLLPRSSLSSKKSLIMDTDDASIPVGSRLVTSVYNFSDTPSVISPCERIFQVVLNKVSFVPANSEEVSVESAEGFSFPYMDTSEFIQFVAADPAVLFPGKVTKVRTGLKVKIPEDTFILLEPASGLIGNYVVVLANNKGIIDSDYYDNKSTGGHIQFLLVNLGYVPLDIPVGTRLGFGTILNFGTTENGITANEIRVGGMGSTDEK